MTYSRTRLRAIIGVSVIVCVCLSVVVVSRSSRTNATTRANIESILLAESLPPQKLKELAPYVKLGENISTVHRRIAPKPSIDLEIDRPTEHSYGLAESNLVLAIRTDGTVSGIGRHQHGIDDGTIWLAKPKW